MKSYQPDKFEVGRGMFYDIITDFCIYIWLPTYIICYFFNIQITSSNYTEPILWFWLVTVLLMLFFGFRKFDFRRAFIIQADEQGIRLQYYSGHLYFFQKLTDVKLNWQDIERIYNDRHWSPQGGGVLLFIENTLFIHMKDRECYTLDIDYCSTLMKTIDKELNEMLKQYGEPKEEEK